jgi:hypothetical protein
MTEVFMYQRTAFLLTAIAIISYGSPLSATEDKAITKDLKATIALHSETCDQVVDVKRNGDSDYLASCKDGNRYRVFVDAQGRVVVKKQ